MSIVSTSPIRTNPNRGSPAGPRATARSFPKSALPLKIPDVPAAPWSVNDKLTPSPSPLGPHSHSQYLPAPTPPYTGTDEISGYPYHQSPLGAPWQQLGPSDLMPPPSFSPSGNYSSPVGYNISSPAISGLSLSMSPSGYAMNQDSYGLYPACYRSSVSLSGRMDSHLSNCSSPTKSEAATYMTGDASTSYASGFDTDGGELYWTDFAEYTEPDAIGQSGMDIADAEFTETKKADVVKTPRPPNAWILYRSDQLKAIGSGQLIPGLEAVQAEIAASSSASASSGPEKEDKIGPVKKKKKAKKGAKEPTEGMLALGRGKTGRGIPQADISKMISMLWKRESPVVRAEYERRSEEKKQEHRRLYPGYKFQPQRKADKIKMREEKEREREAAKREKALLRSGGTSRGGRRVRTRTRVSPSTPYTAPGTGESRAMGRSLSYGGASGTESSLTSGPSYSTDSREQGKSLAKVDHLAITHPLVAMSSRTFPSTPSHSSPSLAGNAEDPRFRSYPFPMPPTSLPSMRREDHAALFTDSFAIPPGTSARSSSTIPPDPSAHGEPLRAHAAGSAGLEARESNSSNSTFDRSSSAASQPDHAQVNDGASNGAGRVVRNGFPASSSDTGIAATPALMSVDRGEVNVGNPDRTRQGESAPPHGGQSLGEEAETESGEILNPRPVHARRASSLVEEWGEITKSASDTAGDFNPAKQPAQSGPPAPASVPPLNLGNRSQRQVRFKPVGPPTPIATSFGNIEIPDGGRTPTQMFYPVMPTTEGDVPLRGAFQPEHQAYWYNPADAIVYYMPTYTTVHTDNGDMLIPAAPFGQPSSHRPAQSDGEHTQNLPMFPPRGPGEMDVSAEQANLDQFGSQYIDQAYWVTDDNGQVLGLPMMPAAMGDYIPMNAVVEEETGPFLSERPMFSPMDGSFALQQSGPNSNYGRHERDYEGYTHQDGLTVPMENVPRHVSSSAYPPTPHSMGGNPSSGMSAWTDRSTSFALAGSMSNGFDFNIGEDLIVWDENDEYDRADYRSVSGARRPSKSIETSTSSQSQSHSSSRVSTPASHSGEPTTAT